MENKTLKPGQLATLKNETLGTRAIVRASKKVIYPCHDCYLQSYGPPCGHLMSVERCQELFGWEMFPVVIYEKGIFGTREVIT